jgi:hypothetical protein
MAQKGNYQSQGFPITMSILVPYGHALSGIAPHEASLSNQPIVLTPLQKISHNQSDSGHDGSRVDSGTTGRDDDGG